MQDAGLGLALPFPALQWQQHDSECIFVKLEVYLTTSFSEFFCFSDFFGGTGRDKQTDGQTDSWTHGIWTARLFLENIVLDY